VVALLAVGVAVLLANPRHRAFYFGPAADEGASGARRPGLASFPRTQPTRETAWPEGARVPTPDAEGRIVVPVADQTPWRLPVEGAPPGWLLREFAGNPASELVRTDGRLALRLRADRASFAVYRDVVLDPAQFAYLTWSWKVMRLPPQGDVRYADRNDQAAQVYVIFPRWPHALTASDVIGYVWDSHAPSGTRTAFARAPNVRVIVVQSGVARTEGWVLEQRNLAQDYTALFGRRAPRVGAVALMIDADDTQGEAEAYFGDLTFSRAPLAGLENMENATSMLR
jgi:hypothetical protein